MGGLWDSAFRTHDLSTPGRVGHGQGRSLNVEAVGRYLLENCAQAEDASIEEKLLSRRP
jgi:predicted choloylglycine hydrolase